jgi:hypothetical protein
MSGLTLALHRADKAASVARSRAVKALEKTSEWATLSAQSQVERKHLAIQEVNRKRDAKKKALRDEWIAKHGDNPEEEGQSSEGSLSEDDSGSAVIADEGGGEVMHHLEGQEDEEADEWEDEKEGDRDFKTGDLSIDDTELGEMLSEIRARQYAEHLALVAQLEEEGEKMRGQETPDDYVFGGH